MVLETVEGWYKSMTKGSGFKHFHWWKAMKHQPKWIVKSTTSSITDLWVSSSDCTSEEDVTRPMGKDRAKARGTEGEGEEEGRLK
jgi:hypothetical protein